MNEFSLGLILAAIVVINWFLQYYFSKKDGFLGRFKNHFALFYLDWLFVPFNFVWPLVTNIQANSLILILCIFFIANVLVNLFWLNKYIKKGKEKNHLYDESKLRWTGSGWTHFVYSTIQSTLVFSSILFNELSVLTYLASIFLILFFLGGLISSKKIHGKVILSDLIYIIVGIILVILGLIL